MGASIRSNARQLHLLYDGSGQSARMDHDPAAARAAALAHGAAARPTGDLADHDAWGTPPPARDLAGR